MLKTTVTAILLSGSLLASAASAQTAAPAASNFVTMQETSQFRASKFVGLDVYGSENEKIGDISEILVDANGNAKAVVVGVGGFLGIGTKNVALPWSAFTWVNEPMRATTAATDARPATTSSTGNPPAMGGSAANPAPATTPARSPAEQAAYNGYPDHAKVSATKAQLNEAPEFKYVSDTTSSTGTTTRQ
jgi:sporulation protein YlmC with PRC-barrel domain